MRRLSYFANRSIRATLLAAAGLIVAAVSMGQAAACSRCGYSVCRYQYAPVYHTAAPYVAPSYDYVDHRFQVTYNITFPPPAVSGATAYAYTPPTLSLLDPALYLNSASRYLELSQQTIQQGFQQFSQTSQVILQGQQGVEEVAAQERLLEKAAQLVAASSPAASSPASGGRKPTEEELVRVERLTAAKSPVVPQRADARRSPASVESIVSAKCIRCHGPDRQSAGLRLDSLSTLDRVYEGKIIAKILADDPADRMPPPGAEKLTVPEKLTFLRASGICGKKE